MGSWTLWKLCGILLSVIACAPSRAETITVGVAISLKDAAGEIAAAYKADTGQDVEFTFGSSGQLMAQVKNGAPIDVFISAAEKQVEDLAKEKLVDDASRRVVARNRLVLIAPRGAKTTPRDFSELADAKWKRIAIGEPRTVPAGQYAMQALRAAKAADALRDRLIYGSNVRQVLDYVERGEVDAGIVYLTDGKQVGDKVTIVATADPAMHEPIVYPAVVVTASRKQQAARKFLEYLGGEKATKVLEAKGFTPGPSAEKKPGP
jgi:molybdate transport system substrate-binding protein